MTDVRYILIHADDRGSPGILVEIARQDIPPLLASATRSLAGVQTGGRS